MKKVALLLTLGVALSSAAAWAEGTGTTYYQDGKPIQEAQVNWGADIQRMQDLGGDFGRFTDFSHGYGVDLPQHYKVDTSMSDVQIVLSDDRNRVEITNDNFANSVDSALSYVNFNKGFLKERGNHLWMDTWTKVAGYRVHVISWSRDPLAHVPNDKNHYYVAEFIRSNTEVTTVEIKSMDPISINDRVLSSFRFSGKVGTSGIHKVFYKPTPNYSPQLDAFYKAMFSDNSPQRWGFFYNGATVDMSGLLSLEKRTNYKFNTLIRYQTLDTPCPEAELQKAWDDGRTVELTLQTMLYNGDNGSMMYDILGGKYDNYFRQYAKDVKRFGKPVLFRLNNEMNGDWCVYSAYHYSRDPELYKAMWHYLHNVFKEEGADNVLWVWNPNAGDFPHFKWNSEYNYFPGESYVDVVGLTGYNTGTYYPGERWRTFDQIYASLYAEHTARFSYPLMITEFGCNIVGGNKPEWVQDMFTKLPTYNRIKLIIWFDGTDLDSRGNPARTYRIDEDPATVEVFRANLTKFAGPVVPAIK